MKNEKIISREKIESKVREIYKEAREWCDSGYNRCCDIMIDTEDARFWADYFMDEVTRKVYGSDSVERLSYGWIPFATVAEKEQGYINDAIQKLKGSGWAVTE